MGCGLWASVVSPNQSLNVIERRCPGAVCQGSPVSAKSNYQDECAGFDNACEFVDKCMVRGEQPYRLRGRARQMLLVVLPPCEHIVVQRGGDKRLFYLWLKSAWRRRVAAATRCAPGVGDVVLPLESRDKFAVGPLAIDIAVEHVQHPSHREIRGIAVAKQRDQLLTIDRAVSLDIRGKESIPDASEAAERTLNTATFASSPPVTSAAPRLRLRLRLRLGGAVLPDS
jgi:hypothetical protein